MPDRTLGEIISAIGEPDFVSRTAGALRAYTRFELAAVILHRDARHAEVLFDNFDSVNGRRGIDTYVRVTRRLNPMVGHCGSLRAVRACDFVDRAAQLPVHADIVRSPDEELGYRTVGWPERQEEIALYVPVGEGLMEIGLYRDRGRSAASAVLLRTLESMGRPIAAAFDRHHGLGGTLNPARTNHSALTSRESEICGLLLRGWSTEAIALRLSISRYTVKDHRKSIFRKLGISSLAELFTLALHSSLSGGICLLTIPTDNAGFHKGSLRCAT
jgi:DNA-binding CsgD family transcriptional regulator